MAEVYAKHARISESNHVCNIEDESEHDDWDEAAISSAR
jgi:hypothetical protein